MKAWIGLGSNMGDGCATLGETTSLLESSAQIHILRKSSLYRTTPQGDQHQRDFTNAVIEIETGLEPLALLGVLQGVEHSLGRVRNVHRWGPRTIDLDLLMFGDKQLETAELTLPHPRMHERAFVLIPLMEIAPGVEIPGKGSLRELLKRVAGQGIECLQSGF